MDNIQPISAPTLKERLALLSIKAKKPEQQYSRCPNCKKEGFIKVLSTLRSPAGRRRERRCYACGYFFETQMTLPHHCEHCNAYDDYKVSTTRNLRNGVLRIYQCRACKKYAPTFENFPIPDDKVKRPRVWND